MDGTAFESKRRATEEQYFAKLAEEQRRKFAERLHEKELKELLQVLPPVRLALARVVCCWRSLVWLLLAPGESRTIPLVIRTASLPAGPHAWNLSVSSADTAGGQWNKSGRMVGIVKRDVDLEPGLLALSTDRETIHTVVIRDSRKTPLSVTGWQTTLPGLVVEKRETAGTETRLTVRVPALPEGRHAGSLILSTSDEAYRQLEIPVTVLSKKQDSVRMAPDLVELSGPAGTTVSRLVRLTANGNLKLKIQEIVVEGVVATTRYAEGPGNSATVRVETNLPAGEAAGRLIIKIEGREQPALLPLTLKGS